MLYVSASVKSIVQLIDIVLWLRGDDFNKDKMWFCVYFLLFHVRFTDTVQSSTWNNYIFSLIERPSLYGKTWPPIQL